MDYPLCVAALARHRLGSPHNFHKPGAQLSATAGTHRPATAGAGVSMEARHDKPQLTVEPETPLTVYWRAPRLAYGESPLSGQADFYGLGAPENTPRPRKNPLSLCRARPRIMYYVLYLGLEAT